MNRWLMIGSLVGLLMSATGCLHHNTRNDCNSCQTNSCQCNECNSGGGLLGQLGGKKNCNSCNNCNGCRNGCVAGPIGWQQGGHNYSSHLNPGLLGHDTSTVLNSQPFQPGPPSAQTAYPYYTHRGPRDFLLDNPPSIGR
ncbi:hypothetical protein [Crateriforma conspicua]|uniref:Uncharacterized protein n=1 Tax=Crateriforma conspicua TaxID=2527996 RepID=A0A5C5YC49_9PLAN|nr:hypothetical protein [Crateriforma conspicua]TWT72508.1 hypothetical protein Pan14r_48280 [Crateriforma conspicua]